MEEIYISRLELQRWSFEFDISYSKKYMWDLESDDWLIPFEIM